MPLVPMSKLLHHARSNGYAVGYFEAWNLESLLAVKDAAEATGSPVIIGFNGGFLENPARRVPEELLHYGRLGRAVAEQAAVPAALILNEAGDPEFLLRGLAAGFTVVMHNHERCSHEESVAINRRLVREAHAVGAEVEAELGELPALDVRTNRLSPGRLTDPEAAAGFVAATGVDALAVAVGNVHMLEGRQSGLDLDLIGRLRERVEVPLVLHGGTGIEPAVLREAIRIGISKINVGTVLRRTFMLSLQRWFREHDLREIDANEGTSTGGPQDLLARARDEVRREVAARMELFGSAGQAPRFTKVQE